MREFGQKVSVLVSAGEVRISEHGYDALAEDGLTAREVLGLIQSDGMKHS